MLGPPERNTCTFSDQPVLPFDHTGLPVITVGWHSLKPGVGLEVQVFLTGVHCDDRQSSVIKRHNRLIEGQDSVIQRQDSLMIAKLMPRWICIDHVY